MTGPSSPGAQLRAIHDQLRAELADLHTRLAGGADAPLPPSLLTHCLTVCGSVAAHHDRESTAFPDLQRRFPDLAPAVARLQVEHATVARLVDELRVLLSEQPDGPPRDRATLRAGVGRLTAELEAHFTYEETQLVPALDATAG